MPARRTDAGRKDPQEAQRPALKKGQGASGAAALEQGGAPRRPARRKARAAAGEPKAAAPDQRATAVAEGEEPELEQDAELGEGETLALESEAELGAGDEVSVDDVLGQVEGEEEEPAVQPALALDDEEGASAEADEEASPASAESEETEEVEEGEATARSEESATGNFLALYFKEMAALSVLRPEEEVTAAQEIERLEVALWAAALNNPQSIEFVLAVAERAMDNSLREFDLLRKGGKRARDEATPANQERFSAAAVRVAQRLRAVDLDKRILDVVLAELRKLANSTVMELGHVPGWSKTRSF